MCWRESLHHRRAGRLLRLYRHIDTLELGVKLQKVWRPDEPDPLVEGLEQMDGYLSGLGLETGWLVIFDRRPNLPRLSERTRSEICETPSHRRVTVIRG